MENHVVLTWRLISAQQFIRIDEFLNSYGMQLQWSWEHDANTIKISDMQRFMLFMLKYPLPVSMDWKDIHTVFYDQTNDTTTR